jgi:exosome complex component CSL4
LTLRQAHVEILVVENQGAVIADNGLGIHGSGDISSLSATTAGTSNTDVGEGFGGIVRVQDVRATERDKVKILQSFKPGDIIRAKVISLGDGTNYYLSTANNDLGVIFARSSVTGKHMYPIDWQTMKCSVTGITESRKCANPF